MISFEEHVAYQFCRRFDRIKEIEEGRRLAVGHDRSTGEALTIPVSDLM